MYVIDAFIILYFIPRIFALTALAIYRSKSRKFKEATRDPGDFKFEGISIVTSVKGPTPHMADGVKSYLEQDYPGSLELIIAAKEPEEPLLAEAKALVANTPSKVEVSWIERVDVSGDVNPRTLKISKGYQKAKHPWIFVTCVDTRFDVGALRRMMLMTEGSESRFVTSFPVIDAPMDFAARLEAVGLNVDVAQFFLSAAMSKKLAIAYGGGLLFHRSLLERAGGFTPIIPLLTDDITFAQAFTAAGAEGRLAVDPGFVRQESHSWKQFWNRQVRWRMISRYFLSHLYALSFFSCLMPAFWIYCFVCGAMGDGGLLARGLSVIAAEIVFGFFMQAGLSLRKADRWSAWVLPIYDYIGFFASCRALTKNEIIWGGQRMKLNSKGAVTSIKIEE